MRKVFVLAIVLAVFLFPVTVFAGGQQEGAQQGTEEEKPEETELVVYSTIFAEYAEAMKEAFEEANPGVTVHVLNPGGTESMMKKLDSESSNPQADVVHAGSSLNYEYAIKQDLIEPYAPQAEGFQSVIKVGDSELVLSHPEDYYHSWSLMFTGIMYNSQVMEKNNLPMPDSYQDLTNPAYEGHIISANPLQSSTAFTNVMATIQGYDDEAWELWEGINKNLPYYSNSSSKIYSLTKKGEFAFAISLSRPALVAKQEGYPVDFIFPKDGTLVYDNAMALVKNAKHPELAKKFMDFILSNEMQREGAKYLYIPAKKGVLEADHPAALENVTSKMGKILVGDSERAEEVTPKVQEVFGKYIREK